MEYQICFEILILFVCLNIHPILKYCLTFVFSTVSPSEAPPQLHVSLAASHLLPRKLKTAPDIVLVCHFVILISTYSKMCAATPKASI